MTPLTTFLKDILPNPDYVDTYVDVLEEQDESVNGPLVAPQQKKRVSKYFMRRSDFDRYIENGVIRVNRMHDDGGDVRIGPSIPSNAVYFEGDVVYFEGDIVVA